MFAIALEKVVTSDSQPPHLCGSTCPFSAMRPPPNVSPLCNTQRSLPLGGHPSQTSDRALCRNPKHWAPNRAASSPSGWSSSRIIQKRLGTGHSDHISLQDNLPTAAPHHPRASALSGQFKRAPVSLF